MKLIRSVVLVTLLSLLAACGKASEPQAVTPASSLADNSVAAIAAPAAEPAAESSPTAEAVATSVNETVETAETSPLPARDIVLPANNPPAAQQTNWQYKEGDYYSVLTSAQGGSSPAGKIEVAEVFWYGCGHCYNLEPVIADWEKRLPSDVNLVRIPVMWNPTNEIHARIFYTAEALGKRPPLCLRVPFLTPKLSSLWLGLVTPVDVGVAPVACERRIEHVAEPMQDHRFARLRNQPVIDAGVIAGSGLDGRQRAGGHQDQLAAFGLDRFHLVFVSRDDGIDVAQLIQRLVVGPRPAGDAGFQRMGAGLGMHRCG